LFSDALEVIISYLSKRLNSGNCLSFRKLGILHSLPKLVAKADQYILNHFEEISKQDMFYDLDAKEIEKVVASDQLKVCLVQQKFFVSSVIKRIARNSSWGGRCGDLGSYDFSTKKMHF